LPDPQDTPTLPGPEAGGIPATEPSSETPSATTPRATAQPLPTPTPAGDGVLTFAWEWDGGAAQPSWILALTRTAQEDTTQTTHTLTQVACPADANAPQQTTTPPATPTPVNSTTTGEQPSTDAPGGDTPTPQAVPPTDPTTPAPVPPSTGSLRTFCGTLACPGAGAYTAQLRAGETGKVSTDVKDTLSFGLDPACTQIPYDQALSQALPNQQVPPVQTPPPSTTPSTPPGTPPPVAEHPAQTPGQPPGQTPGQPPGQTPGQPPTQSAGTFEEMKKQFEATTQKFAEDQQAISQNLTEAVSKVKTMTPTAFRQLVDAQNLAAKALFEGYAAYVVQWAELMQAWAQEQVAAALPPESPSTSPTPVPGTTAGEIVQGSSPGLVMTLKSGIWGPEMTIVAPPASTTPTQPVTSPRTPPAQPSTTVTNPATTVTPTTPSATQPRSATSTPSTGSASVAPQVTGHVSNASKVDTTKTTPEGTTTTSTTATEEKPVQEGTTEVQTSATSPEAPASATTPQAKKETTP
jgi:hypothetical protein